MSKYSKDQKRQRRMSESRPTVSHATKLFQEHVRNVDKFAKVHFRDYPTLHGIIREVTPDGIELVSQSSPISWDLITSVEVRN
jgi:hypothetical protein